MTTLSNLELATGWTATGALGNDVPGSGTQAAYGLNQDAAFYINSPGPYGNGYMYRAIPVTADVTAARTFHYSFSFLLHAPQQTYVQALEYEFERHVAGTRLNFALQMDFVGGNFRHFDYVNSRWIANGVSCPAPVPDVWHYTDLTGRILTNQTTGRLQSIIDSFSYDTTIHYVSFLADALQTGVDNKFTHAFQLDTNGQNPPPPFQVFVKNMELTYS